MSSSSIYKSEIWYINLIYNLKTSPKTLSPKVEFDTEDQVLPYSFWHYYITLYGH